MLWAASLHPYISRLEFTFYNRTSVKTTKIHQKISKINSQKSKKIFAYDLTYVIIKLEFYELQQRREKWQERKKPRKE